MKILHCNTFDIYGGAARAAHRLHRGLMEHGVDSRMLVQNKRSDDWSVFAAQGNIAKGLNLLRPFFDALPKLFYLGTACHEFTPAILPGTLVGRIRDLDPDLVHLHWLGRGFCRLESLKKIRKPMVWTLHDMWAFTGGCHVAEECSGYTESCGRCPQLGSNRKNDLSHAIWQRKKKAWQKLDFHVVTPSRWLADCARASSLFRERKISVIPNGLNLTTFKPMVKEVARRLWNLPQGRKLLLFGAMDNSDRNKGFHLLQEALHMLRQEEACKDMELVIFGRGRPETPPDLGFRSHYVGRLHDDVSLASLYSAVDVIVVPSMKEAFCQIASEAMACGCPVVAFASTGLVDIVDHKITGYLATPFFPDDLAKGILWILGDDMQHDMLTLAARQKAERHYDIAKVVEQYETLYREMRNDR
ncbi:glycosyltransferase family 4 protein [Thiovibrio sp. JS02]